MKVLVLMSTYNGEKYVREQIDSLLIQSKINIGILIRDDGSRDATISILQEYQARHTNIEVEYGNNIGCAESFRWLLNAAYTRLSEYNYFSFCDQDDVWLPDKLIIACNSLELMEHTIPCMYCSNLRVVDANLNKIDFKWKSDETFITKEQSLVCSMATGCTMVFNRKVIDLFYNNPPEKLHIHDLWIMHLCMFLGKICYDNNSYILYRQHGNNVIGAKVTFKAKLKNKIKSFRNLFAQHENELEAQELLLALSNLLTEDDEIMIRRLANYRKNIKNRMKLLLGIGEYSKIRRKHGNFFFFFRIILGVV